MDLPQSDPMQILNFALQVYEVDLNNYVQLWLKSELNDEEFEQLEDLYTKAQSEPLLDFIIIEVDRILGERVGFLEAESIKIYKDQQAWLREHLEQVPLENKNLIDTQKFLSEAGFYKGPLDGIRGNRSRQAAIDFNKNVQYLLQKRGFYHGMIDGELGNKSVTAVREFQESQNLKRDGVPRRLTYGRLAD